MSKSSRLYIEHIIESIELIESFVRDCSKEFFSQDRMRYDAVLRNLQIMAESTQKLPQSIKDQYSNIPWKDISGFRNVLVHDYLEGLDDEIIWSVIKNELPSIKEAMIEICKSNFI